MASSVPEKAAASGRRAAKNSFWYQPCAVLDSRLSCRAQFYGNRGGKRNPA